MVSCQSGGASRRVMSIPRADLIKQPKPLIEQPTSQIPRSNNLSLMQTVMLFALVSFIYNHLSAFVAQATAGKSWDDIVHLILSFLPLPYAVNARQEIVDAD